MIVVCLGVPSASAVEALTPLVETTDMNGGSDVADDMCVWLHPTDRSKSIIFGNNKTDGDDPEGGIYCYALDGGPTDTLSPDTLGWGAGNWFDQGKKGQQRGRSLQFPGRERTVGPRRRGQSHG